MSISPSFLIKKPSKSGLCLIYLQAKWNGYRLLYSTKENVPLESWDRKKQRVKNNQATTKDGHYFLNDLLANMESVVMKGYRAETASGTPTVSSIRKYLDDFFENNGKLEKEEKGKPTLFKLIDKFIDNEILYKGKRKAEGTIKTYRTTKKHLLSFEKKTGYKLEYNTITLEFFYKWVSYLRSIGVTQNNSINKYVACLKAFMSEAADLGYSSCMEFRRKKFYIGQETVENVYLKDEEILMIYNADVSHNPNLENVKDAYVICCLTGIRFSDLVSLRMEHIQEIGGERFINKETLKTGEQVIIPLNDIVISILAKYKNTAKGLPKIPHNVVYNKQLKSICKAAGLDEVGRLSKHPEKMLWECVSSHTGRRSFATNAYLKGIPIISIMRMTGHRTEKSFMRYIQLGKLDAARSFSMYEKMDKSKLALKLVG